MILLLLLLQDAREVPASDRPVELRVPVATDARHRATVVTFPEDSLEALVAGWAEADLSVERRREKLFIKLLRKAEGDLHVMGGSGALYRLAIRASEGAYDGHVRIVAARPPARAPSPEPIELIRAMRLGRRPPDARVLRADAPAFSSAELSARTAYVYDTDAFRGFVLRVENVSGRAQRLDPSRLVGKGLVLAGSREMLLEPGARTLLYLVIAKAP